MAQKNTVKTAPVAIPSENVAINEWTAEDGKVFNFVNIKGDFSLTLDDGTVLPVVMSRKGKLMVKPEPVKVSPAKGRPAGTQPATAKAAAPSGGFTQDQLAKLQLLKEMGIL